MLKPISRCDLAQDSPVPPAAKGSSWFWHLPFMDAVNKVAAPSSSCPMLLPCPFPITHWRGTRKSRSSKWAVWCTCMLPKLLFPPLTVKEDSRWKNPKGWAHPRGLQMSVIIWQLIENRQTQTACLSLHLDLQEQLASANNSSPADALEKF